MDRDDDDDVDDDVDDESSEGGEGESGEEEGNNEERKDEIAEIRDKSIVNVIIKKEGLSALVAICCCGGATNSSEMCNIDNANLCADGVILLSESVDLVVPSPQSD
jgi:hypothetical protein